MPEGTLSRARRMWSVFEVVHAPVYFAPEPVLAYQALGLHGYWRGYYAGRVSSPLGAVGPDPVVPIFHCAAPRQVPRAFPDTWARTTPADALAARLSGVSVGLERAWRDLGELVSVTAGALREAVDGANLEGCPLGSVGRTVRVTTTRASRRDPPRPAGGPAARCERPTALHPDAPDRPPPPAGTPTSGRSRSRLR